MNDVDVVVVGAGLSGLIAARDLQRRDLRVAVLEARDRVGGRSYAVEHDGETFDLGGQWIGPGQHRVAALADSFGVRSFPQHTDGRRVLELGGRTRTYRGTIPRVSPFALLSLHRTLSRLERLRLTVSPDRPWDAPDAARWDGTTVEAWMQRHVRTAEARAVLAIAVRAIFAVEPADLSMLHFLFYLCSGGGLVRLSEVRGGAQERRFEGGAQQLSERIADELGDSVRLGRPVRAIEQRSDGLIVRTDGDAFSAARAIVAIPPALVRKIELGSVLDGERAQLVQRMPMGSVIKCVALYDRPFWRDRGLSGEAVSDDGPVGLAFDDCSADDRKAALVGFLLAEPARRHTERSAEERKDAVIGCFARWFGHEARTPTAFLEHDWVADPWSTGCYVGVMAPGTMTSCGRALRRPSGRVFWAGTETAVEWNGYLEGAIEAGERAAREVVQNT